MATSIVLINDFKIVNVISIGILAFFGLSPFFAWLILHLNRKNLGKPSKKAQIGSLFGGLKDLEENTWER